MQDVLGASPAIEALRANIGRLLDRVRRSPRLLPVLIQGETGTGKGLLAEVLHRTGPRAGGPFVAVNCAAIPEGLLEAELFGFERGAFTDAKQAKPGLFQTAHRGVLFLDEVGLLPAALQAKLLNAIEEGSVRRLGSTRSERVDVWIISASNVDLRAAILERRFREDLYQRLAGLTLSLPPLRERGDDVIMLAEYYLAQASADFSLPPRTLTTEARARLRRYRWPGNVRELANLMERAALLSDTPQVTAATLDLKEAPVIVPSVLPPGPGSGAASLDEAMRDHLQAVLDQTGGNISHTAAILGIARNTLRSRIRKLGLKGSRPVAPPAAAPEGAPLAATDHAMEPEVTPAPRSTAVRWERRHVTLLRVALAATGDESLLAGHLLSLAVEKVLGFGGRIEALGQTWLDASFGAVPIENAARRAASAALAFHKAALEAGRPGVAGTTLIHTKQTTVGQVGDIIAIDDAQRAVLGGTLDRMAQHASPGVVHVSGMTAPFLARHFELRGDERPGADDESAFIVVRPDPSGLGAWRRLTRFVGREVEMDVLRSRGELASRGRGQVIGLVGEPGVGKSRLVWEFLHEDPDRGWLVLEAVSATPGRPAPFFAVIDMLRLYFDVSPGEAKDSIRDKIVRRLALVDETLMRFLPVFLTLFDVPVDDAAWQTLDPSERRRQILAGIKRLMLRESTRQPLVLVFEDAHWADGETRELLDEIADSIPVAHVLMLVTYRPEYQHGWTARSFYTQLRVEPLRGESADRLVDELLGADASLAELRPLLIQWTDGNPFFIEEVVRTLGETGALRGEHGTYRLTHALDGIVVPGTVEEVLASRISRLGPGPAGLLRAAAVVGRQVPYAVLAAVSRDAPEALDTHLHDLQSAEFLYQAGDSEEREYVFRHALTQEVAYASLPAFERHALHARVLDAMERLYPERMVEQVEQLAHHAVSADERPRAVRYLVQAGRKAASRSALIEALGHLETALELLRTLPEEAARDRQELELQLVRAGALRATRGFAAPDVGHACERTIELCQRLGDPTQLLPALNGMYSFRLQRAEYAAAEDAASRLLELARRQRNETFEMIGLRATGAVLFHTGRLGEAHATLERALAMYDPRTHAGMASLYGTDHAQVTSCFLGLALWLLGDSVEGLARLEWAVAHSERLGHAHSVALALSYSCILAVMGRYEEMAQRCGDRLLELAARNGLTLLGLSARFCLAAAQRPRTSARLDEMHAAAEGWWGTHAVAYRPFVEGALAEAHADLGDVVDGLRLITTAQTHVEATNERWIEAELYRIHGRLLASTRPEEAETRWRRAIEVARAQDARLWELRASRDFAEALDQRGQRAAACKVLDTVLARFPTTIDNSDVRAVRVLHASLA